jgi:hypothetical protein
MAAARHGRAGAASNTHGSARDSCEGTKATGTTMYGRAGAPLVVKIWARRASQSTTVLTRQTRANEALHCWPLHLCLTPGLRRRWRPIAALAAARPNPQCCSPRSVANHTPCTQQRRHLDGTPCVSLGPATWLWLISWERAWNVWLGEGMPMLSTQRAHQPHNLRKPALTMQIPICATAQPRCPAQTRHPLLPPRRFALASARL